MLILSRKLNESIIIGDNIRITVASIRGRYVRIGVEAPGEIPIYREELLMGLDADSEGDGGEALLGTAPDAGVRGLEEAVAAGA